MEELIPHLFTKYLEGNCSDEELKTLMVYFKMPENELLLKQRIIGELKTKDISESEVPDLDNRLNSIYKNVQLYIDKDKVPLTRLWTGWKKIAVAASVVLISGAGLFYYKQKNNAGQLTLASLHAINPGKNAATLTLANGRKILLSDNVNGLLAKQTGVNITKTGSGQVIYLGVAQPLSPGATAIPQPGNIVQYNTISTANGQQFNVILPDGSNVTLNAASSIKFPASFAGLKERRVELSGEAYFAVKHNSQQPFKVDTKNQQVEDIGTEFDINSYVDEPGIKTTLVEGSAKVSAFGTETAGQIQNGSVILTRSQQSVLTGNALKVKMVNAGIDIAWKSGRFAYQNTPLQEVMRQVARWYDVEVAYDSEDLKLKRLSGSVSRYDKVADILNAIEYTAKVRFKIDSRKITVMPGE
ncbi:FecR domain-containing protein [Mucilaginibacter sp.]|uniref:FecR family protein n=1 Tax=Mucilaginibacter sp. TaxID=1882438 RepID=UPI00262E63CA|nr:FecR domain-containing protein [Mucilaginibacter sp.]MDB4925989.1 anti-sigma factor [Mucilaginibacter sp.]